MSSLKFEFTVDGRCSGCGAWNRDIILRPPGYIRDGVIIFETQPQQFCVQCEELIGSIYMEEMPIVSLLEPLTLADYC